VIDFGLSAFQQTTPPTAMREGDWVAADIYLGIDPFFYFEQPAHSRGMPPLIYDWIIREILVQTAPFIETRDDNGTRLLDWDESKSEFQSVENTDAWKVDSVRAGYVLRSELLGTPPRRKRE